jgi:hypothetical protein
MPMECLKLILDVPEEKLHPRRTEIIAAFAVRDNRTHE